MTSLRVNNIVKVRVNHSERRSVRSLQSFKLLLSPFFCRHKWTCSHNLFMKCLAVFLHLGVWIMDEADEGKANNANSGLHAQQLCRFFSQGRHCNFGDKCRFLHIRDDTKAQERKSLKNPKPSHLTSASSEANAEQEPNPRNSSWVVPAAVNRPCRYFLSGHCSMEDRCRFWHPPQLPSVDDQPRIGNNRRPGQRMPVPRPNNPNEAKLSELTEDVVKKLRDTEIEQLKKRFPREQLIIQEQNGFAYYRASIEATDPDWVKCLYHHHFN